MLDVVLVTIIDRAMMLPGIVVSQTLQFPLVDSKVLVLSLGNLLGKEKSVIMHY